MYFDSLHLDDLSSAITFSSHCPDLHMSTPTLYLIKQLFSFLDVLHIPRTCILCWCNIFFFFFHVQIVYIALNFTTRKAHIGVSEQRSSTVSFVSHWQEHTHSLPTQVSLWVSAKHVDRWVNESGLFTVRVY